MDRLMMAASDTANVAQPGGGGDSNTLVKFQIERLDNNTFVATLITAANSSSLHGGHGQGYDDEGALYYVVAVVFIYGFSIILMIGSLIKRNKGDNGVGKYMKDMDKVHRLERRQKKYQTRLAMSAAGGSRRASRALAARGVNIELVPHSAPPGGAGGGTGGGAETEFNWADIESQNLGKELRAVTPTLCHTSGGAKCSSSASPRLLTQHMIGRPSPGRAAPVSPRLSSRPLLSDQTTPKLYEDSTLPDNNLQMVFVDTCTRNKVDDVHVESLLAPVQGNKGAIIPETVKTFADVESGQQHQQADSSVVGGVSGVQQSTMLYIESEKDSKCKVTIVPAQVGLGTVHEVDEEHACSPQDALSCSTGNSAASSPSTAMAASAVVHV